MPIREKLCVSCFANIPLAAIQLQALPFATFDDVVGFAAVFGMADKCISNFIP